MMYFITTNSRIKVRRTSDHIFFIQWFYNKKGFSGYAERHRDGGPAHMVTNGFVKWFHKGMFRGCCWCNSKIEADCIHPDRYTKFLINEK